MIKLTAIKLTVTSMIIMAGWALISFSITVENPSWQIFTFVIGEFLMIVGLVMFFLITANIF